MSNILPLTAHERECALAAIAMRIEKAKTTKERQGMKRWYKEILNAPDHS